MLERMEESVNTMGGWSCHWTWGAEGQGVKVRQRHDNMTHTDKWRLLKTGHQKSYTHICSHSAHELGLSFIQHWEHVYFGGNQSAAGGSCSCRCRWVCFHPKQKGFCYINIKFKFVWSFQSIFSYYYVLIHFLILLDFEPTAFLLLLKMWIFKRIVKNKLLSKERA